MRAHYRARDAGPRCPQRRLPACWRVCERASAHPDYPAIAHYTMSDTEWRVYIAELRGRGYRIAESIVTHKATGLPARSDTPSPVSH